MFACRLGKRALQKTRIILLVRRSRLRRTGAKWVGWVIPVIGELMKTALLL
jgi:hypothetical protein